MGCGCVTLSGVDPHHAYAGCPNRRLSAKKGLCPTNALVTLQSKTPWHVKPSMVQSPM